ncbi:MULTISPECIES: DUF1801 domain-containing protein [unclassified Lentimicrobium]|uniref:DUF1801 domain-containing protein n=1 Tax=unclassified Lentimicrobium TaxID=2677434 RepID=UPI0015544045|nr:MULTISPECIES: DUF1801 domain-containing protein [unclassified Lentimicrobium]NPD44023.1 DUF1801 domain-containing protein [Lentimicrobium sp. S6]NPD84063.1 DUF1801 domain-containing protein [Lentimicrobium sp. L6]
MAKYELKTKLNDKDVIAFLEKIEDEKKRSDSFELLDLFTKITMAEPKMWGENIIGFGSYHYKYESGQEGQWFKIGFSPRKAKFSLYVMSGFDYLKPYLDQLGKHKIGKSCLYVNKLADIDKNILENLVLESFNHLISEV